MQQLEERIADELIEAAARQIPAMWARCEDKRACIKATIVEHVDPQSADDKALKAYCAKIRKPSDVGGLWGGDLEIFALSEVLPFVIHVHSCTVAPACKNDSGKDKGEYSTSTPRTFGEGSARKEVLHLRYANDNH